MSAPLSAPAPTEDGVTPRLGAGNPDLDSMVRSAVDDGTQLMLLHIDIDHFAAINQNMGYEVGDSALQIIGHRLKSAVGDHGRVWRHGSDEFLVAVKLDGQGHSAKQSSEGLKALIEQPVSILPYTFVLTAKVGISLCPDHASTADGLLQLAESSLLRASRLGDEPVQLHEQSETLPAMAERTISPLLVEALGSGQFSLRYQPKISARDGRVIGMEALIRWNSPELGELGPERFIRTAERLGVIVQMGEWMIESAVAQAREWRAQGFDDFFIGVNVSTLQLLQPAFVDHLLSSMQQAGLPPTAIVLEINESVMNTDMQAVFRTIRSLRREGIGMVLDNFGTGDASLRTLARYPADILKIDRSFVTATLTGSRETAIVRAMIAMAHQLGMKVIANGVETEAQLGFLRRTDCDYFQGFLFAKAVPAEEAGQMLRQRYLRPELFTLSREDRTLLLVDDEENVLSSLGRLFRRDGYRVLSASNVNDALALLGNNEVHVILSDQRMPEMSGTDFLAKVKMLYPDTIRMVLSGHADLKTVTEAINRGAIYRFLTKPWDDRELRDHIRQAFRTWDARRKREAVT